jgi:regulator of sigma E protease
MLITILLFVLYKVIPFLVVLGVLVLAHEFGHFIAAKASGVKVEEFSIGFPPRILAFKRGETNYVIGLLPLGGYVKMLGEDESSNDPRAFNNQSAFKRFVISIAGVVLNFVLAWLILTVGFMSGMSPMATPANQVPGKIIKSNIYIAEVRKDSASDKAGLQVGDSLVSGSTSDGIKTGFNSSSDVSTFTKSNLGKQVTLEIKRDNQTIQKEATISQDAEAPLGVGLAQEDIVRVTWYKAPIVAIRETGIITEQTFVFLGSFLKGLFAHGQISDQVGGPVAIFKMSGAAAKAGIVVFLQFIAILSINLGLVNALPFPALDGGRILFIVLEKIFGKRIVKADVEGIIHTIGFALLIILILAVTYKDIFRR